MCKEGHSANIILKIPNDMSMSFCVLHVLKSGHVLIARKYSWKVAWVFGCLLWLKVYCSFIFWSKKWENLLFNILPVFFLFNPDSQYADLETPKKCSDAAQQVRRLN